MQFHKPHTSQLTNTNNDSNTLLSTTYEKFTMLDLLR